MTDHVHGPAPRPCSSCPYRCDVPSGVWSAEDYAKLPQYDLETWQQPPGLFLCHQTDPDDPGTRVCAGWVGCHGDQLLGLRLAASTGVLRPDDAERAFEYTTPVELHPSGTAACEHGLRDLDCPSPQAQEFIDKIGRRRPGTLGE